MSHFSTGKRERSGSPRRGLFDRHAVLFLVAIGVILANFRWIYGDWQILSGHKADVASTNAIIHQLEELRASLSDAEASQKGYLITGREQYLSAYTVSVANTQSHLDALKALLLADPARFQNLVRLEAKLQARLKIMEERIQLAETRGREAALEALKQVGEDGQRLTEEIRILANTIADRGAQLLELRTERARESETSLERASVVALAMNLGLVVSVFFFLRRFAARKEEEARLSDAESTVTTAMRGIHGLERLTDNVLNALREFVRFEVAAVYTLDGDGKTVLKRTSWAGETTTAPAPTVVPDQGLMGEAFRTGRTIIVDDVPAGYLPVNSALGRHDPACLLVAPLTHDDEALGVIEIGAFRKFTPSDVETIDRVRKALGNVLQIVRHRSELERLLRTTQEQAEELKTQQEELRASNEELEKQTEELKSTQAELELQRDELQQTNTELAQQTEVLERQKEELRAGNAALEVAKKELETRTAELERVSRFKTDFLANMSHELRTPLNSIIILSSLLSENQNGNLTDKQIEYARTIVNSSRDLLALINDILDLSKVEAGKLALDWKEVDVPNMLGGLEATFREIGRSRDIGFEVQFQAAETRLTSDFRRIEQILRNFLANAFKFTDAGGHVTLSVKAEDPGGIRFCVRDTGIGIPGEKLKEIFEAFRQLDAGAKRQYGGTGLGLTISNQLAALLHGRIEVESEVGKGSVFSLVLPLAPPRIDPQGITDAELPIAIEVTPSARKGATGTLERAPLRPGEVDLSLTAYAAIDDRDTTDSPRKAVLVVEDDHQFAKSLYLLAKESGFDCLMAETAEEALTLLGRFSPVAILLDIKLPSMNGLALLEKLKRDLSTRHIPVHVISALDYQKNSLLMGAIGFARKPVDATQIRRVFDRIDAKLARETKRVLVVEDDPSQRLSIGELIGGSGVDIVGVGTAQEALSQVRAERFDCMVLDLSLPDMSGLGLLEKLRLEGEEVPPVVIYTGRNVDPDMEAELRKYSDSIIIKGACSPERLLDKVSLFLHRVSHLSDDKLRLLAKVRSLDEELTGRSILLVDDDMRNVFALSSALESQGFTVHIARNGKEAIHVLEEERPDIDLVLMDIMMPEMDGYEAIERIRASEENEQLPIIALTAKAMRGDQEKCIAIGANDYLPKPVDLDQLLSLIKVWMPRPHLIR